MKEIIKWGKSEEVVGCFFFPDNSVMKGPLKEMTFDLLQR